MWFNIWITGAVFTYACLAIDESTKFNGILNILVSALWFLFWPVPLVACAIEWAKSPKAGSGESERHGRG